MSGRMTRLGKTAAGYVCIAGGVGLLLACVAGADSSVASSSGQGAVFHAAAALSSKQVVHSGDRVEANQRLGSARSAGQCSGASTAGQTRSLSQGAASRETMSPFRVREQRATSGIHNDVAHTGMRIQPASAAVSDTAARDRIERQSASSGPAHLGGQTASAGGATSGGLKSHAANHSTAGSAAGLTVRSSSESRETAAEHSANRLDKEVARSNGQETDAPQERPAQRFVTQRP